LKQEYISKTWLLQNTNTGMNVIELLQKIIDAPLVEFIHGVANLADGVIKGYVRYEDLHRVLVEEQGLEW